jgi:hypothetical protein
MDSNQNVLMGMMLGGIPFDDDFPARDGKIHPQMIDPPLVLASGAGLDGHATGNDSSKIPIEPIGMLADIRLHGRRGRHVAKADLDRKLHGGTFRTGQSQLQCSRSGYATALIYLTA